MSLAKALRARSTDAERKLWRALERLPLEGDETVLDAGCGSGRVTHLLEQRLPHGHVIAVDASPAMVEKAKEALRNDAEVFVSDLTELELDQVADAVFSNAVFHWIPDHDTLFKRMFAALKPGGRLVVQCGGAGNIEAFLDVLQEVAMEEPFAEYVAGFAGPWYFASPAAWRYSVTTFDPGARLLLTHGLRVSPRSTSFAMAPTDSSMGISGSTRDMQNTSRASTPRRFTLCSQFCVKYAGELPLRLPLASGVRGLPDLE